ncbi:MAG: efflux RND transporter permease subunit, partial [candidate division Zixibacteria bacterium]|nr:efflux RND transporter permease subunit [candidate division Zixibacteria bacterium]
MRKIFEFSVKNPLFVNLLTVIVVVAGIMALTRLNLDIFPNVNLDLVVITTIDPGSTPSEIEKSITIPIEKELKKVNDIKEIRSVSLEGMSNIVVEIEPDASNKPKIANDVQRAADRAELPADLEDPPLVDEMQMKDHPIITLSLSADSLTEDQMVMHAKALETILLDQPDVAAVSRYGWRDREIWVEVDPELAAKYYLPLAEIITILKERNVNISGGSVIEGASEKLLRISGEFGSGSDIEGVMLRANERGNWVQVSDIAKVTDTFKREELIIHTDGKPSLNLVVIKKERGDAIGVVSDVTKIAEQYVAGVPGLNIAFVDDMSFYIKRRLNVLISNGWVGIILVVCALFLFLSSRAALVTTVGIPIAFLTAFAVMYWSGLTINLITMVGLIIVLGMLVDDAIVVAENVFRLHEQGMPARKAAVEGALQVWKPVTTSVLTTMAAFAPLMFMSGIIGKFMIFIPLVVIVALAASLFEAFVILPSHLAEMERIPHLGVLGRLGRMRRRVDAAMNWAAFAYSRMLSWLLHRRYKVAGVALVVFIGSFIVAWYVLPFVLFPARGIDAFFIRTKAPLGTPLQETARRMEPLEKRLAQVMPEGEMDNFVTYVGVQQNDPGDPAAKRADHLAQINVYLKPHVDRRYDAQELVDILKEKIGDLPGFEEVTYEKIQPGPPVGKAVEIHVRGDDFETLERIGEDIKAYLGSIKGVSEIKDSYEPGKDELNIVVDEKAASRAGLTIGDVGLAVRTAIDGTIASTIKKSDEEIDIRVLYPDHMRYDEDALNKIFIPNDKGRLIPLTAVAQFEEKPGVLAINHLDRQRVISVTADVDQKNATAMSVVQDVMEKYKDLGQKYPGYSMRFGGEWEKTLQSLRDFGYAIIVACLIIFLLLTFEFQSVIQPLIVMF